MKKLKLTLAELQEEIEVINPDDLGSIIGGTGYYGYNTWNDFIDAVSAGNVADGTYFDDGTSAGAGVHGPSWMYDVEGGYGGGYGEYGQSGYGQYDHLAFLQMCEQYEGSYMAIVGNDSTSLYNDGAQYYCVFDTMASVAKTLGLSGDMNHFKESYRLKKGLPVGALGELAYDNNQEPFVKQTSLTTFTGVPGTEVTSFFKHVFGNSNVKTVATNQLDGYADVVELFGNLQYSGITAVGMLNTGAGLHEVRITGMAPTEPGQNTGDRFVCWDATKGKEMIYNRTDFVPGQILCIKTPNTTTFPF